MAARRLCHIDVRSCSRGAPRPRGLAPAFALRSNGFMNRRNAMRSRLTPLAVAAAVLTAAPLLAQSAGETIEGTITRVELRDSPRHIMVRWNGTEVQQRIANRTLILFDPAEQANFPDAGVGDLKPGMEV